MAERTPQERETLLHATPEEGRGFAERVGQRVAAQPSAVRRDREVVGEAVAEEMAAHGEPPGELHQPWRHSPQEHAEVQQLVDVVFARDLAAALKQARTSPHYPRNIDLLHDVLTGELYDVLRQAGFTRQPVAGRLLTALVVLLVAAVAVVGLIAVAAGTLG